MVEKAGTVEKAFHDAAHKAHIYRLARLVYIYTVYDRIFGEFPAQNTVYTPYIYGSGQPYTYTHTHRAVRVLQDHDGSAQQQWGVGDTQEYGWSSLALRHHAEAGEHSGVDGARKDGDAVTVLLHTLQLHVHVCVRVCACTVHGCWAVVRKLIVSTTHRRHRRRKGGCFPNMTLVFWHGPACQYPLLLNNLQPMERPLDKQQQGQA
jgi:hypothetical protein